MCTSRIDSFSNLSILWTVVSKNVVSNFETSAVNFMVGWYEFACSMNFLFLLCLYPTSKIHRQ